MSVNLFNRSYNLPDFTSLTLQEQPITNNAPLFEAIISGNVFQVDKLLKKNPGLVNIPLSDGELPLQAAVRLQRNSVVRSLMSQGADSSLPDYKGMTALDYAALNQDPEMLRLLLPAGLAENLDALKKQINFFYFAEPNAVQAIRSRALSMKLKSSSLDVNSIVKATPKQVIDAIFGAGDALAKSVIAKASNFNECDIHGLSPMHFAAATGRAVLLQEMAARGGDLFAKNNMGVAPADLLFTAASEKDPHRFQKAKLLLTFLKVSSVLADLCLSDTTSRLWRASMFLLYFGSDLALTYQAYQQLNLKSFWKKSLYWASSVVSIPVQAGLLQIPGARFVWDILRAQSVCREAFVKISSMWKNVTYNPYRSIGHIAHQITEIAVTGYQIKGSLHKVKEFLLNDASAQDRLTALQADSERTQQESKQEITNLKQKVQELELVKESCELPPEERARLSKQAEERSSLKDSALCKAVHEQELFKKEEEHNLRLAIRLDQKDAYCEGELRERETVSKQALSLCKSEKDSLQKEVYRIKNEADNNLAEQIALCKVEKDNIRNRQIDVLSNRAMPFVLDEKLNLEDYNDAVCTLFGEDIAEDKALPLKFEQNLAGILAGRKQHINTIIAPESQSCQQLKESGLVAICNKIRARTEAAVQTILKSVNEAQATRSQEPLPFQSRQFKCNPHPVLCQQEQQRGWINWVAHMATLGQFF